MEIIDLDQSVLVRGVRTIDVRHEATGCARGLEPGEAVVLRTAGGDLYAAQVQGVDFLPMDTVYTFLVGARLPEDLATERVAGLDPARHDVMIHDVVDLLGGLRPRRRP
jgi:hypothetical protein